MRNYDTYKWKSKNINAFFHSSSILIRWQRRVSKGDGGKVNEMLVTPAIFVDAI